MATSGAPFKIFVGADRSQLAAVPLLEYSVKKYASGPVQVIPLVDMELPYPLDPRNWPRTNFSFCRFAIPMLCDYSGEAVYVDADMQVFKNIFDMIEHCRRQRSPVVIQQDLTNASLSTNKSGAPARRKKQCAVMYLNCSELAWDPYKIIAGLDGQYNYNDLMDFMCIEPENRVASALPASWNSLEHYEQGTTGLVHYTDMYTQPWVSPMNPIGYLWINELKEMIDRGVIDVAVIEGEVRAGYFRPSLVEEVLTAPRVRFDEAEAARFQAIDDKAGFVRHREVYERKLKVKQAIAEFTARGR